MDHSIKWIIQYPSKHFLNDQRHPQVIPDPACATTATPSPSDSQLLLQAIASRRILGSAAAPASETQPGGPHSGGGLLPTSSLNAFVSAPDVRNVKKFLGSGHVHRHARTHQQPRRLHLSVREAGEDAACIFSFFYYTGIEMIIPNTSAFLPVSLPCYTPDSKVPLERTSKADIDLSKIGDRSSCATPGGIRRHLEHHRHQALVLSPLLEGWDGQSWSPL